MGLSREDDVRRLAQADKHIADGERRIARQTELLAELNRDGRATTEAEKILTTLSNVLSSMREHRKQITATIANIDAGLM